MFDGIKLDFENKEVADKLLNNPIFNFFMTVENSTATVKRYKAQYNGLTFYVYTSNRVLIVGSLHVFYNMQFNSLKANYDDFSLNKVKHAITSLEDILQMPASAISIRNIEFGFNIELDSFVRVKRTIQNFIVYKNRLPYNTKVYDNGGYGIELISSQSVLKIYDKGAQNRLPQKLIRVEKGIKAMQNLSKKPVYLSELLNINFWSRCYEELLKAFQNCLYIDTKIDVKISLKDRKLLKKFQTPIFWEDLTHAQRSYYSKEVLPSLIQKYGFNYAKIEIQNKMEIAFNRLITS
jgi:hypothetical protein